MFCLEVLGKLVHSEAVVPTRATAEAATADAPVVPPAAMFACVFGRCSDVSPSVRSAALKTLAEMTEGGGAAAALLAEVLASDAQSEEVVLATVLQDEEADLATVRLLPSRHRFISFIRRRALDLSVAVRRSALQVLENLLRSSEAMMADSLVEVMAEHCRDSSLAVRKQMVVSLSELVRTYPGQAPLVTTWVQGVFPLILDVEAKAAEKVSLDPGVGRP